MAEIAQTERLTAVLFATELNLAFTALNIGRISFDEELARQCYELACRVHHTIGQHLDAAVLPTTERAALTIELQRLEQKLIGTLKEER